MLVDGFESFDKLAILRESGRMTPGVRVALSWADAAAARQAPKLRGDPRSLWKGRFPDKPPVTEPCFYAMAKDGCLFRDGGQCRPRAYFIRRTPFPLPLTRRYVV